ncbi:hypothetical protein TNCV_2607281 [Trichonephila clavipes]|uniref:Uncharacterized protein n=1 Tax=Trichonephila clavipes TaxID=2585209 RepID=A0A8X6RUX7_TRICX|nr:hypothetical protein TNCV_2607281 [Trichonephila clavipes]
MNKCIKEKKGAIASRRLDLYLLVRGRYFISLLPPIGNQWRRSPPGDAPFRGYRLPRGYHLLVVVVVLVSNNKCIMEKKRCHSIQEVGLVPVGPRKVFYFPSTTHWKPMEAFPTWGRTL